MPRKAVRVICATFKCQSRLSSDRGLQVKGHGVKRSQPLEDERRIWSDYIYPVVGSHILEQFFIEHIRPSSENPDNKNGTSKDNPLHIQRPSSLYLHPPTSLLRMSSSHDLAKSAKEIPHQTQGKTFPQPVSSPITETTEGVPRAPERAYTKVPYRSPTAPRAEPSSSTIDKVSAPISSCKDLDTQHAHSSPPTDTAPHLRGGDWVECGSYVLCCLCLCDDCCYAYGSTRQE